jgi:hypothetical protein
MTAATLCTDITANRREPAAHSTSSSFTSEATVTPARTSTDAKYTSSRHNFYEFCFTLSLDFNTLTSHDTALTMQKCVENKAHSAIVSNVLRMDSKATFNQIRLSKSSQNILNSPNAGGASELSEALSFELLSRCFGVNLIKTEMDIMYNWINTKKTDYSARVFGNIIGVSVTRAMKYRGEFTLADADCLLRKKLYGIECSSYCVTKKDRWSKQLLHIFTSEEYICELIFQQFKYLMSAEPAVIGNTVVLVTLTKNAEFVYTNQR